MVYCVGHRPIHNQKIKIKEKIKEKGKKGDVGEQYSA